MFPHTGGHCESNYPDWSKHLGKILFNPMQNDEAVVDVSLVTRRLFRAATSLNTLEVIRPKYQIFQQKTRKLLSSCCNDSTLSKVDSDKDCAIELSHHHSGYAVRWWNLQREKTANTQLIREGNRKLLLIQELQVTGGVKILLFLPILSVKVK